MAYLEDGKLYEVEGSEDLIVEAVLDRDVESPRQWQYNMGMFHIWANGYDSPDPAPASLAVLAEGLGISCEDTPLDFCRALSGSGVGMGVPVWMQDHSGVTYEAASSNPFMDGGWDSGIAGVIYTTWDKVRELTGEGPDTVDVDSIVRELKDEVSLYNEWAAGRCYGYRMYNLDGVLVDSCYGYCGEDSERNGIDDSLGTLAESRYASRWEWAQAVREGRWEWRQDLRRLGPQDGYVYEGVCVRMAHDMLADEEPGAYALEDMLGDIAQNNVYGIAKNSKTYGYLEDFWGGHAEMMRGVRLACEDDRSLYFYTGNGYDVFGSDLFGGNVPGLKGGVRAFEEFVESKRGQVPRLAGRQVR